MKGEQVVVQIELLKPKDQFVSTKKLKNEILYTSHVTLFLIHFNNVMLCDDI